MREKRAPRRSRQHPDDAVPADHRLDWERYYRDGAVMIWPLQVAILNGLLDRPRGTCASSNDCISAAMPHAERLRGYRASWWMLHRTISSAVGRGWVDRKRKGRHIQLTLTRRGRAIANGEVVTRFNGGELYIPGRRIRRTDDPAPETVVALGHGIDLVVPGTWTANVPAVAEAIRQGRASANGSLTEPDPNRILISLTPTDDSADRVPITIMLLPGGMTQAECAALSDAAIAKADAAGIRPEAESAAAGAGFKVTWWGGTERGMVGRRFGLITHYAFAHPDGRRHRKETHVAYLGTQQVVVHVTLPAGPVTLLEREVRRILDSLRLRAEF